MTFDNLALFWMCLFSRHVLYQQMPITKYTTQHLQTTINCQYLNLHLVSSMKIFSFKANWEKQTRLLQIKLFILLVVMSREYISTLSKELVINKRTLFRYIL